MFRVYFINHDYYSDREFANLEDAINYAKSTCFECGIHQGNQVVASWSPMRGVNRY